MNLLIRILYTVCVNIILCLPSLAIVVHMLMENTLLCEGSYSTNGVSASLLKYLLVQNTIIALILGALISNINDNSSAQLFGLGICGINFINSMIFWNLCNRCGPEEKKKCGKSRAWVITLGFVNVVMPVLYYLQTQLASENLTHEVYTPMKTL